MGKHIKTKQLLLILFAIIVSFGCKQEAGETIVDNILLKKWIGPYGGVPAFDKMKVEDIKEAAEEGMKMNLTEIDAIANNPDTPTFENTIEEMERAGAALNRGFRYYGILSSNMSTPEFREIQAELADP